jgi:hypothetical protein
MGVITGDEIAGGEVSKREQILSLYEGGTKDIEAIAHQVKARVSHVIDVLHRSGHLGCHWDLYEITDAERNIYARYFRSALDLKDVGAARESVARIDRLYNYFERLNDRMGMHHAQIVALTGKNRARWSGKTEEAEVFAEWLASH